MCISFAALLQKVVHVFAPEMDAKTKLELVKRLEMLGVVEFKDFSFIRAKDLLPVLSIVEARKMVALCAKVEKDSL